MDSAVVIYREESQLHHLRAYQDNVDSGWRARLYASGERIIAGGPTHKVPLRTVAHGGLRRLRQTSVNFLVGLNMQWSYSQTTTVLVLQQVATSSSPLSAMLPPMKETLHYPGILGKLLAGSLPNKFKVYANTVVFHCYGHF